MYHVINWAGVCATSERVQQPTVFTLSRPRRSQLRYSTFKNLRQPLYICAMDDPLYAACAEVLTYNQSHRDDLSAILDPETGFAPSIRYLCQQRIAQAYENPDLMSPEEVEALRMESDTWGLLQALIP